MAMIRQAGLEKIADITLDVLIAGEVRVDGSWQSVDIYHTELDGNKFAIYYLMGPEIVGTIDRVRIIDENGSVFAEKEDIIEKPTDKPFVNIFRFEVIEKEAV